MSQSYMIQTEMHKTSFGEIVMSESDLCDLVMQGRDVSGMRKVVIDPAFDLEGLALHLEDPANTLCWTFPEKSDISMPEFDRRRQEVWFMPREYRELDIAQHVLNLCQTQEQLQRAGEELLLYQERGLFDLLRYLKYLVDVMQENHLIWGVGRGSSVSSYVLYLLRIHRVDSMYYDLDIKEFLR